MKKKKIIVLSIAATIVLALLVWTIWGNTALEVNTYTVSGGGVPSAFDGYRIAQISDLHNAQFGKNNEKLLSLLRETKPDMIAITGDLIDSRNTDVDTALHFVKEAVKIAPCYYVTGNHEARVTEYFELQQGLAALGMDVLDDEQMLLEREGEAISVIGLNDPSFQMGYDPAQLVDSRLRNMTDRADYTVLLSHRPELFDVYVENGIDLALTGHAHGGQFRLPFVGGLFAPDQGLLPEYDAGRYTEGNTNMIVSRGIGNSAFPLRFNNRPEIVLIELQISQ